jgi:hypothetical protein
MAKIKIPYYVVKRRRNGERKGYWQPTMAMIARGAQVVTCGLDGPDAWALAGRAYTEWMTSKRKDPHTPREARAKDGTIGAAFSEYRKTAEWTAKAPRTREDWERAWKRIGPAFGGVRPSLVTMAQLSEFRLEIEAQVSTREAHRCIKIWRALWRVMVALKYCSGEDPALAVRNVEPQRRQAVWEFSEVRRLADRAWRERYYGLAAVIAVAWDTSLSPVDVRDLRPQDRQGEAFRIERAKTGRAVLGTLTRRSTRVLAAYQAQLGVDIAPSAPIFRNRSGARYSKDTLGDDFRDVRAMVFGPDERRTVADMRRSGAVEARRGGASDQAIGNKLGNAFASNKMINETYGPTDLATVRQVDAARRRARRKIGTLDEQKLDASNFFAGPRPTNTAKKAI